MDDLFLDQADMTTEQRFMFMLQDRITNLEKSVNNIMYGDKCVVADRAKTLHERISNKYKSLKREEADEVERQLKSFVPQDIFADVPEKHYEDLLAIVNASTIKYRLYCAYRILEHLPNVTQRFVDWLALQMKDVV